MTSTRIVAGKLASRRIGILGLSIALAVVVLPSPRASGEVDPPKPAAELKEFALKVVGPDGKPIPNAEVDLRIDKLPPTAQVRRGTFTRKDRYGLLGKADSEGRFTVEIPRKPSYFDVYIQTPGYGSYWAGWSPESHAETIPDQFTAELDAGWSVGGIVVDGAGKPVPGVKVGPSAKLKKRPGDNRDRGSGGKEQTTDASGKWHFDSVPVSLGEVFAEISHPDFKPLRRPLTRSEFGIERGREPTSKIVLDRGLTVTGKVTDEAGKPIAGATVRTEFLNDRREAKTKEDGTYALGGCEPVSARIVAFAKGRALDMQVVTVEPTMKPVDFALKPGGTVRIRVLNHEGKPIPKARIFFQRWRGDFAYEEFEHVNQYADKDGVWVWDGAPPDQFTANISPNGGDAMVSSEQPLIARAEEYVFRLAPRLVISGKVIDAETKASINTFRVTPGIRGGVDHMNWVPSETFTASGGRYELRQRHSFLAHLLKIEADGYLPAESRDIKSDEGKVTVDFALKRGKDHFAKVVTPKNLAAAGAKVALGIAGSQINITNGEIDDGSTYATRFNADEAGRFHFPPQTKDFQLVIVHPSGYAHIKSKPEWDTARIIRLEPWARVEGTFRVGKTPVANVPITINVAGLHSYGPDVASIFVHHDVTTGPDGKFVFERVVAGPGASIGRRIMLTVEDGAQDVTSSCLIHTALPGGKTTRVDLGGTGRAVVGKLLPADGFAGKVLWNFAMVTAHAPSPYLTATVDRDGSFRIDDVPPGKYSLGAGFFAHHGAGQLINYHLVVPAGESDKPIDLGTLKLEK